MTFLVQWKSSTKHYDNMEFYDWKEFFVFAWRGSSIKNDVVIMEVRMNGCEVEVRLKKHSKDEGYLWKSFLRRSISLEDVRAK